MDNLAEIEYIGPDRNQRSTGRNTATIRVSDVCIHKANALLSDKYDPNMISEIAHDSSRDFARFYLIGGSLVERAFDGNFNSPFDLRLVTEKDTPNTREKFARLTNLLGLPLPEVLQPEFYDLRPAPIDKEIIFDNSIKN